MTDASAPSLETLFGGMLTAVIHSLSAETEDERTAHRAHATVLIRKAREDYGVSTEDLVLTALTPQASYIVSLAQRDGIDARDLLPDFEAMLLRGSGDATS